MSIRTPINVTAVNQDERTWRATIETPASGAYRIDVHRELVKRDVQDEIVGETKTLPSVVQRWAWAIQNETVTVMVGEQEVEVSAALIMAALPKFFDRWAQEDANG